MYNLKKSSKKWLAIRLHNLVVNFRVDGVFDSTKKTISTNEASFLYDSLDIIGTIQADFTANNQDKYQFIKKELAKIKKTS